MDLEVENGGIEADRVRVWGKSLPVPSVQEMVRNDSESVPERYIQENDNRPLNSALCSELSEIPVIDFSLLVNGNEDELNKLDFACIEWGFFQEVLRDMKAAVAEFFSLSLDEKKKYSMPENDLQGYGQAYVVSKEQKLDWGDLIFLMTSPLEARNMKYWPNSVPGFKEAVDEYSREVERVSEEIMANMSFFMGMDKNGLKRLHVVMKQSMRMNYYPPCSRPDLVLGVSSHSDGGSITILLQDDDITGLQIKHKGGWLPVKPIPNALVVNIGDAVEAWSNGIYKSIEHRAVTNSNKARMSVATFVQADEGIEIGPVESMMQDRPRMYKNVKYLDYIKHVLGRKMDGKAHTNFLKLESE
ncbi:Oxoglutarate/iron-dependent dioxygenase [Parasponia andersonii]|uniref:Oxoglutarate/iron-dependent dioxygenase n=1 Tax=Parasponia andersonii TaxID=3476 RepID=A0A2P5BAK1_PARAD|nr:Oxoglutarate/iron-dependent dioxygenase [Parasponia andersonii]